MASSGLVGSALYVERRAPADDEDEFGAIREALEVFAENRGIVFLEAEQKGAAAERKDFLIERKSFAIERKTLWIEPQGP